MIIALMMAQIVLVILNYLAHVITLNPWVIFMPSILIGFLFVLGMVFHLTVMMDAWSFQGMYRPPTVRRTPVQMRRRS